jgi:hypothetical protein
LSASSLSFPRLFPHLFRFLGFRFFFAGDCGAGLLSDADFGPGLFGGVGGVGGGFSRFGCTRVGVAGGGCGPGFSALLLGDDVGVAVGDVLAPDLVVIGDMVS